MKRTTNPATVRQRQHKMKQQTTITSITLIGWATTKGTRLLKIDFSDVETVSVAGSYGGFEQYGAFAEHYATSQPIAERYTKWLNGGRQPKPLAKYVTIEHPIN